MKKVLSPLGAATALVLAWASAAVAADLTKSDAIYNALPQAVKDAGSISAATSADYPPFEFLDESNTLVGADIDISQALGTIMGIKIEHIQTEFSNIMPGLQSGRFSVGISSMGDYVSREKTVDFVDYYRGGTSFLIRAADPDITTLAEVCGSRVGAMKGTSSETQALESSEECVKMGKEAIAVNAFPTQNAAVLALTSGRIDSVSGDGATNGYSASQVTGLRNTGLTVYNDRPFYGIAVPKESPLFQPLFDAMGVLMESGEYDAILKKWGIDDGGIDEPMKNQSSPG